ncbi:hypothetical protein PT974_07022 [Cladobotryum mycophilum]|uniref:DUF7580 domain-containing protein n=1 Tax=Cladobotryum mycophilum TaxID=491253 RepID=A0ABR0SNB8_9HYPO
MSTFALLGTFSAVVEAAQHLHNGFKVLDDWWSFEQIYGDFINEIRFENLRLDRNLQSLLVTLTLPNDARDELLYSLDADFWHDPILSKQIKRQLGENYDLYMTTLSDMRLALSELMEFLPIKDGKVCYLDESDWERESRKIQYTFRIREDKTLARIKSYNDRLGEIHSPSRPNTGHRSVNSYTMKSSPKVLKKLSRRRTHAKMLFNALDQSLQCDCPELHSCGIIMRAVKENQAEEDSHMQILFLQPQPVGCRIVARVRSSRDNDQDPLALTPRVKDMAAETGSQVRQKMKEKKISTVKLFFQQFFRRDRKLSKQPARVEQTQSPPTKKKTRANFTESALLGSISVEGGGTVTLFSESMRSSTLPITQVSSLAQAISGGLKNPDRFRMAKNITYAMMELQGISTWMTRAWDKTDIAISEAVRGGMYIQQFPSARATQPTQAMGSLLSLGILLLELAFGQTLESQSFRSQYLLNGEPNDMTDLCTALKWSEQVQDEFGLDLSDAILWCIRGGIGVKLDFENHGFLTDVVENVVMPLENFLRLWER